VVIVSRPTDETGLERVVEAGGAVAGVVRVQVFAARTEMIGEVVLRARLGDAGRGRARAEDLGCSLG